MATIGSNFTFATSGSEDSLYGFSYSGLKFAASESSDTDAFLITGAAAGTLYYNAGSATAPKWLAISDYSYGANNSGVQLRITGVYINGIKVSGSDSKLYWRAGTVGDTLNTDGSVATFGYNDANGTQSAFTVKAIDNTDGVYGSGLYAADDLTRPANSDTYSTGNATGSVILTPVNDAPVITSGGGGAAAAYIVAENQTAVATITATDVDTGNTITYSLSGADAAKFQISSEGVLTFIDAPNFEVPGDVGADNVYEVIVTANDGSGAVNNTDTQSLTITVTNVNEAPVNTVPGTVQTDAARTVVFNGNVSVADPDAGSVVTTVLQATGGVFTAVGADSGAQVVGLATGSLTLVGTVSQVNAALNGLTFLGDAGFSSGAIVVTTVDNGNPQLTDAGDVIAISAAQPVVTSVGVPEAGQYNDADNLTFTVNFDQDVYVTGSPRLALNVGGVTVYATYTGGSGSNALVFTYDVAPNQNDADGIDTGVLDLNGGTIQNAGGADALTVLNSVGSTTGVIIDTTADADANLSVAFDDLLINATEASVVALTVSGVDADVVDVTVTVYDDNGDSAVASYNAGTGKWEADVSDLLDGPLSAEVSVTDYADNTTSAVTAIDAELDTTLEQPTVALTTDTGSSNSDEITKNASLTFGPVAAEDVTREYSLDGVNFTEAYTAPTEDGDYTVTVRDTDTAGNTKSASISFTLDTTAPTPVFLSGYYKAAADTLTLSGYGFNSILSTGQNATTNIAAQLDSTKLNLWVGEGDISLAPGAISEAYVLGDGTLQVVLNPGAAANLEGHISELIEPRMYVDGGFTSDLAGNVDVTSGNVGLVNMPMVYSTAFNAEQPLVNETLGIDVTSTVWARDYTWDWNPGMDMNTFGSINDFDANEDTLHIGGGVSAADVDVFGTAADINRNWGWNNEGPSFVGIQLNDGSQGVVLQNWDASGSGIRDASVVSFDDGSVLRTNTSSGAVTLRGGTGDDLLMAGVTGDQLLGNAGNDRLLGGTGADKLFGGTGDDVLWGGQDSGDSVDYLVGGAGADTFVLDGRHGNVVITDFNVNQDHLLLNQNMMGFVGIPPEQRGSDVVFQFGMQEVRLLGVSLDALNSAAQQDGQTVTIVSDTFYAGGQNQFAFFD